MKIALVGLPLAGKKTLFTLLTQRHVPDARKPGETMEGIALIRDPRVDCLADICRPERKVYAENRFILCPDANLGAAARQWLDAARQCDLLCVVLGAYASPPPDVAKTRADLEAELILADMQVADTRLDRLAKEKRAGTTPERAREEQVLAKSMKTLEENRRLDAIEFDAQEMAAIRSLGFVTLIPTLVVYNVAENDIAANFGPGALTVSAKIEEEIMAIENPGERKEYLASMGLDASGLDRMNAAAYDAMGLMSFYTIGEDEVRAWTIRKGSLAPTAGGKVHTDIERGFIRVEIVKYDDLVAAGSEKAVKERGKMLLKGKDYVIQDGDICHFLFNV